MKWVLLFLLLPCFCNSQMKTFFYDKPWEQISLIKDSVQMLLPSDYVYAGIDSIVPIDKPVKMFQYKFGHNNDTVFITMERGIENGNGVIHSMRIEGLFIVLFPVWKAYYDANADAAKITTKEVAFVPVENLRPIFQKEQKAWWIWTRGY